MSEFTSIVKKVAVGIAEAGVSSIQCTAETYSKSKNIPDEYREAYSDISNRLANVKSNLHDYRHSIGKNTPPNNSYDFEEDTINFDLDVEPTNNNTTVSIPSEKPIFKNYYNQEKASVQLNSATKSTTNLTESNLKWYSLGYLKDIDSKNLPVSGVGIIKLTIDDTPLYVIRAIELNNGGIQKKLNDLQNNNAKNKSKMYTKIDDNIDKIKVDIACLGNDSNAVANTRKIEKDLLLKYHLIDV